MLINENKKNASEPKLQPLQAKQKSGPKGMAIPSLNLETVHSNSLDIGDQFLKTVNIQNNKSSLNKFAKVQ